MVVLVQSCAVCVSEEGSSSGGGGGGEEEKGRKF